MGGAQTAFADRPGKRHHLVHTVYSAHNPALAPLCFTDKYPVGQFAFKNTSLNMNKISGKKSGSTIRIAILPAAMPGRS
jgi:hypothetical protein